MIYPAANPCHSPREMHQLHCEQGRVSPRCAPSLHARGSERGCKPGRSGTSPSVAVGFHLVVVTAVSQPSEIHPRDLFWQLLWHTNAVRLKGISLLQDWASPLEWQRPRGTSREHGGLRPGDTTGVVDTESLLWAPHAGAWPGTDRAREREVEVFPFHLRNVPQPFLWQNTVFQSQGGSDTSKWVNHSSDDGEHGPGGLVLSTGGDFCVNTVRGNYFTHPHKSSKAPSHVAPRNDQMSL